MLKTFEILNFGYWNLFVIWDLGFDGFVKSPNPVTPAKAGVHNRLKQLDSGFRRNDNKLIF